MEDFKQTQLDNPEMTLADFIQIKDGRLVLMAPFETNNFLSGKRGVRIAADGLNASGGTIQGATVNSSNVATVSQGGTGAATLTGILLGNGTNPVTTVSGWSGTFYVATSSGGAVTHAVTVSNGVITAVA